MPSGSHGGGGGGSHFGGSSGGSHFGSSSGGNRYGGLYNGPRQVGRAPIRFYYFGWGGRYYAINSADRRNVFSQIFAALIVLFISVFICVTSVVSSNASIRKIESDYIYYQDMIAYAEEHNELLVTGTVKTKFLNEDVGKYYITYYFLDQNGEKVDGYTFSIYTYDEVKNVHSGDDIELAVDSNPITQDTDSINLDYKDMPLSKDGEYESLKNGKITSILVSVSMLVLFETVIVISLVKQLKNNAQQVEKVGDEPTYSYVCTYCGAKLKKDDTSCPKCGSSTIETVKQ